MNANKITLAGYIVYLQSMYKRYGNISIAQLKHIERIRKKRRISTITLSDGLSNWGERTSIFMFISFKELKDMAIERLTKSLEQHQKMYEEL